MQSSSPTYNENGNLTSDSRWTYTWDGENRLIAMETTSAALSASVPKRRLEFLYDGQSRRICKKVMNWDATTSVWITKDERRFVYDGWNSVAEVDNSGNLIQTHTWGMDLSGTAQGAGGVGGLLWSNDVVNTQVHFAAYDGNGNVVAMISTSDSKVKARYDYNAFGETVLQEGDGTLVSNPYRFSTKYQDEEAGLYYYGYRYYNPTTGRWLNRDPIEESGGVNLYAMVGNDPLTWIDRLGLTRSNCQKLSKKQQIQLSSAELLQQGFSIFNATGRGALNITVAGEKCKECCHGSMKDVQELTFSVDLTASVNATFGANFKFGIPSGNLSGWAGIRGEASFTASGSGSFTKGGCNDQDGKVKVCVTTSDVGLSLLGGGQAVARFGRWRMELVGATVKGSATIASAKICLECDETGCSFAGIDAAAINADGPLELNFTLMGTSYSRDWTPW